MNLAFLKIDNQQGLTLMELVVALSLTGILLVVLVGANVFVHKVLTNWARENTLVEERVYLLTEIADNIASCDYLVFDSTAQRLVCYFQQDSISFLLRDGVLSRGSVRLNRSEIEVNYYNVVQGMTTNSDSSIKFDEEPRGETRSPVYSIELSVSNKGKTDVSFKKVRNLLAFHKK